MKFEKESIVPLAGILSLSGFILFTSLLINDFNIDAVRPDINRKQSMVVAPDIVNNEELNDSSDVNLPISGGDIIMEDENKEDGGQNASDIAENKYTRVSHKDYTKYLESSIISKVQSIYNSLSSDIKGDIYFCIFYRGHNVSESGSGTIIEYADPYSKIYGSASNLGGIAINKFALRYANDISDKNKQSLEYSVNNLKATVGKMDKNITLLEAYSKYKKENEKQYLKMWGYHDRELRTLNDYYKKAVNFRSLEDAVEYLPNIKQVLLRNSNEEELIINNTKTISQKGNSYIPEMSINYVKMLSTPYNQYPNRDGKRRAISQTDEYLLAKCVDDGYSKLMIIFGSESGKPLKNLIGENNYNIMQNILHEIILDTEVKNSVFKDANLILQGEKATR